MDTLFKCWASCIPTCAKSTRCPCRFGRSRNRVGPSQAIKVIVAPNLEEGNKPTEDSPRGLKLNGETNLYFQGDEVTFTPGELGSSLHNTEGNGSISNGVNGHSSCNGDCSHSEGNTPSTSGLDLDIELTKAYYAFLSTVYLQLTKDKKIRVINIKPNSVPRDPSKRNKFNATVASRSNVDEMDTVASLSSDSSDDEEYWFTRWSRKPKLKNVFKPKPEKGEISEPRPEVAVELNSKFKYEDIPEEKDLKEHRVSLKRIFRRPSSTSLTDPSNLRTSQSNNANYSNAISSDSCSRPSEDVMEGTTIPSDSISRNSSNSTSQLELARESPESHESQYPYFERSDSPPPSFTNFAFQPDSEDEDAVDEHPEPSSPHESSKTEDSDRRHFEVDIHAGTRRKSTELIDLSQHKLNGDLERRGSIRSLRSSQREKRKSRDAERDALTTKEPEPEPDTSKPILFFIHGISGSSETWKSQFEYFHDYDYEIVAPDLLGHGLSSTPNTPKHYLFESLVQDLTNVFDHFVEEERKAIIVGHGYGACLGTVLSRIRPKNVCLLISVSGGGPTPMVPPDCFESPLHRLNLFAKKRQTGRFDNPDLRNILPRRIHQHFLDGQLWLDGDAAFHRRILVPTLLVYGMRDKVVSMIEECEMERTIPKAFLELIPTAGHMIMWDEPKKFNKMLIKFIHAWLE